MKNLVRGGQGHSDGSLLASLQLCLYCVLLAIGVVLICGFLNGC